MKSLPEIIRHECMRAESRSDNSLVGMLEIVRAVEERYGRRLTTKQVEWVVNYRKSITGYSNGSLIFADDYDDCGDRWVIEHGY